MTRASILCAAIFAYAGIAVSPAQADTAGNCRALADHDFGLLTAAPTVITSANVAEAANDVPDYCRVQGIVSPQIGFELQLPLNDWNGKFLFQGCGAMCGQMLGLHGCAEAVARGYACATTDMGHRGLPYDGKWAYNNPIAERDFGHRATHVATIAGKAVTDVFYGDPPTTSYFRGCSTGGRQALVAAQRYPADFDGIIAGAPALYTLLGPPLQLFWGMTVNLREDGSRIMSVDKLPLVYRAAVAACDKDDGIEDGLISSPQTCSFDPAVLECKGRTRETCLSGEELKVVQKLYTGAQPDSGFKILANGQWPGSELGWGGYLSGGNYEFGNEILRYLVFSVDPGPTYDVSQFDWDTDPQRMDLSHITAGNPNLGSFRDGGGKLIMFQGMADAAIIGSGTEAYYSMMSDAMGGTDQTLPFARLFHFPGMDHCRGGAGLNHADLLSALEAWVEQGDAPDLIMGYHFDFENGEGPIAPPVALDPSQAAFSRPIYPFPAVPEFTGGDWRDANNYRKQR